MVVCCMAKYPTISIISTTTSFFLWQQFPTLPLPLIPLATISIIPLPFFPLVTFSIIPPPPFYSGNHFHHSPSPFPLATISIIPPWQTFPSYPLPFFLWQQFPSFPYPPFFPLATITIIPSFSSDNHFIILPSCHSGNHFHHFHIPPFLDLCLYYYHRVDTSTAVDY